MKCCECKRTLEVGDQYIKFTASEWAEREGTTPMPGLDDLMAQIMGAEAGPDIIYCENCTVKGGDWMLDTVYGDEPEHDPLEALYEAPASERTEAPE